MPTVKSLQLILNVVVGLVGQSFYLEIVVTKVTACDGSTQQFLLDGYLYKSYYLPFKKKVTACDVTFEELDIISRDAGQEDATEIFLKILRIDVDVILLVHLISWQHYDTCRMGWLFISFVIIWFLLVAVSGIWKESAMKVSLANNDTGVAVSLAYDLVERINKTTVVFDLGG